MNYNNLIKISLKAIGRNKFRTILTMLGIIIGVASVITMLAIGQGSKQSIQSEISEMGSNVLFVQPGSEAFRGARLSPGQMESLTYDDYSAIKSQCIYISKISPGVGISGQSIYGSENWPTSIQGGNTQYLDIRKYEIEQGTNFTDKDIKTSAKVCLIGKTVIENLFDSNENVIGKTIRFNKIPFKVIGILKEKGDNTMGQDMDDIIIAPYTTVQKRILAITHLNNIVMSAINEDAAAPAKAQIEEILRNQHKLTNNDENDFNIRSQQELIDMFGSITGILTILLAAIASISLLIGGIGIMNIMYVSVTERTREIGLRMAVGGRGIDILLQFLIESVLISFIGGIIGISLGFAFSYLVKAFAGWPIFITTYSIVLSFAVCTIIGVFFGWYPARKAARLDPIDALRYE